MLNSLFNWLFGRERYDIFTDDSGLAGIFYNVLDREVYEDASTIPVIYSVSNLRAGDIKAVSRIISLCPKNVEIRTSGRGNYVWPEFTGEQKRGLLEVIEKLR